MVKYILHVLGAGVFILMLILAALMWPRSSCSVEWLDSNLDRFEGPFSDCPEKLHKVQVGRSEFTKFGSDVYRADHSILTEPAGFPCMTGVTCFPIPIGRRTWETFRFVRLDGPVEFSRLKAYLGGSYISDGAAVFAYFTRLPTTKPPIDPARLRWIPCIRADDEGSPCESYATDGRYIVDSETIVQGADPESFKDDLPALSPDGELKSSPFARDRTSVYAYGKRIEGADPVHFRVLIKNGMLGFDQRHAWRNGFYEVEQQNLSPDEFKQLRAALEDAWATRRNRNQEGTSQVTH